MIYAMRPFFYNAFFISQIRAPVFLLDFLPDFYSSVGEPPERNSTRSAALLYCQSDSW